MSSVRSIRSTYLHVRDGGETVPVPVSDRFWEEISSATNSPFDDGRLLSAFTFSDPWPTWERHPSGEELVMLLTGSTTIVLEDDTGTYQTVSLSEPGSYVLVPRNVWHTARTSVPTTLLFLTPGADTEHRSADA